MYRRQIREAERRERAERKAEDQARVQEEREERIRNARETVESFEKYLRSLTSFHRERVDFARWLRAFQERTEPRSLAPVPFEPAHFEPWSFVPAPFRPDRFYESMHAHAAVKRQWSVSVLSLVPAVGSWFVLPAHLAGAVGVMGAVALGCGLRAVMRTARAAFDQDEAQRSVEYAAQERAREEACTTRELARKAVFDVLEAERRRTYDAEVERQRARFDLREQRRLDVLLDAAEGDRSGIATICEALLPLPLEAECPDPLDASLDEVEVGYSVPSGERVELLIHLPDVGIVPERILELTPSGDKLRYKPFAETKRQACYAEFAASFAMHHAIRAFEAMPFLRSVAIDACIMVHDASTGHLVERPVVSVTIEAKTLTGLDLRNAEPIAMLANFEAGFSPPGRKSKKIAPTFDHADVAWASAEDDEVEVPVGLLPRQAAATEPNPWSKASPAEVTARVGANEFAQRRQSIDHVQARRANDAAARAWAAFVFAVTVVGWFVAGRSP